MDLTGSGGTTVPVLLAVSGFDLDGMLLRCLVLTDLTAQRAADAYNRSLIEASLNPMFTIGRDGAISDVNAATEQATGYGRAELLGTEFSDYFTEPGLARPATSWPSAMAACGTTPWSCATATGTSHR